MVKMQWEFKQNNDYESRRSQGEQIQRQYPDRCAVIVQRTPNSRLPDLTNKKFLVPTDLPIGQFYFLLRKRLNIQANETIFFLINNSVPTVSQTMGELFREHADEDKFLYMAYTEESFFG